MNYYYEKNQHNHLIVLFHGTGGNEYQLLSVVKALYKDVDIISFEGTIGIGANRRFFPPLINGQLDLSAYNKQVEDFERLWQSLQLTYDKITFIGFSNGANFIIGLLNKSIQIDVALLLHPSNLNYNLEPTNLNTNVIMTVGANDLLVPPGDAKALERQFKMIYNNVTMLLLDGGHGLSEQEINALKQVEGVV